MKRVLGYLKYNAFGVSFSANCRNSSVVLDTHSVFHGLPGLVDTGANDEPFEFYALEEDEEEVPSTSSTSSSSFSA